MLGFTWLTHQSIYVEEEEEERENKGRRGW
jgi:hypothetical protein